MPKQLLGMGVRIGAGGAVGPPAPPVLFSDTFTGANGTKIVASFSEHTPDVDIGGTGWIVIWGAGGGQNLVITNNRANVSSGEVACYHECATPDVIIECEVYSNDSSEKMGVIFRYQDMSNYWEAVLFNTRLDVLKWDDGSPTYYIQKVAWPDPSTIQLKVELKGDNIKVYVDDALELDIENSFLNDKTKHGHIVNDNAGGNYIDTTVITDNS